MEEYSEAFPPCAADAPYPEIRAQGRNARYGELMLANIAGQHSEMSSVNLYLYNRLVTDQWPRVAELFYRVSLAEMRHLEIFSTLARQLGVDPRLWCRQGGRMTWWTPAYLQYSPQPGPLIQIALREEELAAALYERQARYVEDANVAANLARVAQDERLHGELFRGLLESYRRSKE